MKKLLLGLAVLAAGIGVAGASTTDSVMLTVTPVFNLSVNISSTTNSFGIVALRSSVTICVGQIINDGNVTAGWQKVSNNTSGAKPWTMITSGTPDRDEFRLLAVTTAAGVTPNFLGTMGDSCLAGDHSSLLQVQTTMDDLGEGWPGVSGPKHSTNETRDLWVSLMMPYDVTSGQEQTITLSVQAVVK